MSFTEGFLQSGRWSRHAGCMLSFPHCEASSCTASLFSRTTVYIPSARGVYTGAGRAMAGPRRPSNRCGLCPQITRTGGILPSPLMGPYRLPSTTRLIFIHEICALWAPEVYCDKNGGTMRNVLQAYRRGLHMRCSSCGSLGATVGCNVSSCSKVFHFFCLQCGRCAFVQASYAAWCNRHASIVGDHADKGNLSVELSALDDLEKEEDETDDVRKERRERTMRRKR